MTRWQATVTFRPDTGLRDLFVDLEALGDLEHALLAHGPKPCTVKEVTIRRLRQL